MNIAKSLALGTIIVGGINWGTIGLFDLELVQLLFGGETKYRPSPWARVVYGLVGASAMMGWTPDFADPDQNMYTHLHSSNAGAGWNLSFYNNENVDELLEMARATNNTDDRETYYYEAQQIAIEEAAYMWIP